MEPPLDSSRRPGAAGHALLPPRSRRSLRWVFLGALCRLSAPRNTQNPRRIRLSHPFTIGGAEEIKRRGRRPRASAPRSRRSLRWVFLGALCCLSAPRNVQNVPVECACRADSRSRAQRKSNAGAAGHALLPRGPGDRCDGFSSAPSAASARLATFRTSPSNAPVAPIHDRGRRGIKRRGRRPRASPPRSRRSLRWVFLGASAASARLATFRTHVEYACRTHSRSGAQRKSNAGAAGHALHPRGPGDRCDGFSSAPSASSARALFRRYDVRMARPSADWMRPSRGGRYRTHGGPSGPGR